jgi:mannosyltransferase OCH1-like enzyme
MTTTKAKYIIFEDGSVSEVPSVGTAAAAFNLICAEMVKYKIEQRQLLHDAYEQHEIPHEVLYSRRADGGYDAHFNDKSGMNEPYETPWTEEEHEDTRFEYVIHRDIPRVIVENPADDPRHFKEINEQLVIENHPDFAWLWEDDE